MQINALWSCLRGHTGRAQRHILDGRLTRYSSTLIAMTIAIAIFFCADGGRAALRPQPDQAQLEHSFGAAISPDSLRDWMKVLASEPNQVGSPHDKAYHLCVAAGIQVLGLINFGAFFSSARGSGTKKAAESKTISAIGRCVSHI